MNRKPSKLARPNPRTRRVPLPHRDPQVARRLFAAAREAFGDRITGLTYFDEGRAFFQVAGDPTCYSVAISPFEASALT